MLFYEYALHSLSDNRRVPGREAPYDYPFLMETITQARLFVFGDIDCSDDLSEGTSDRVLSLPFPICAFEMLDQSPIIAVQNPVKKEYQMLIAREVSPGSIFTTLFRTVTEGDKTQIELQNYPPEHPGSQKLNFHLNHLLECHLKQGVLATEGVNIRVKFRDTRGEKSFVKIKSIVHVRRRTNDLVKGVYGGPLDWSHRWEVQGHWRRITGIGKDRLGKYTVPNMTWVVPHVKGPEHKPLVTKTRLVAHPKTD